MNSALSLALVLQLSAASGQDVGVHGYPSRLEGAEVPPGPGLPLTRSGPHQAYAIFDLQTDRSIGTLSTALERHFRSQNRNVRVRNSRLTRTPDQPGRFQLLDPRGGGPAALTTGLQGEPQLLPVVACTGAVWTATGTARGAHGPAPFTACLFPYRSSRARGYHLSIYVTGLQPTGMAWSPPGRADGVDAQAFISGIAQTAERTLGIRATQVEIAGTRAINPDVGVF